MTLARRLETIRSEILKARAEAILGAKHLVLMGVSKGQPVSLIEEAISLAVTVFGENRVQEAYEKWPALKAHHPDVALHLIGPLQTNKVKEALSLFDVIQTVDRPKLAEALAKEMEKQSESQLTRQFYIQVNTGEEPQKTGISPQDVHAFIPYCIEELKLPVTGLMCIPPVEDLPGPHFALLREIARKHKLAELSMGMSADFTTAIRLGSTCVRIGTALFGERNT